MIKKIIFPLLAILLLSSCAGKFGIQKRRYNKGFYVSHTRNNHESGKIASNQKTERKQFKHEEKINNIEVPQESSDIEKPGITNIPIKVLKPAAKPAKTKLNSNENTPFYASAAPQQSYPRMRRLDDKSHKLLIESATSLKSKGGNSDVKLIILVILAIFLPPLAIYLKDNSVNTWFWVTLIFCLLTLSVFFFVFGGLLWFVSIIIALLYIFGAIS